MPELRVDAATAEDWPEVRALMAQSPMRGALPITLVRGVSMQAAYPHWGAEPMAFVARSGRALVGYLHASLQPRRVGEAGAPVLYVGDLRVASGQRRQGVARALMRSAMEHTAGALGFAYINSDNAPMLRALASMAGVRAQRAQSFRTHVMFSLPTAPKAHRFERMVPSSQACAELCAAWAGRHLGPLIDPETLRRAFIAHRDIHVYARSGSPDRVAFAMWDMQAVREVGLSPSPRWFEALRGLWRVAARAGLTHPLPDAPRAWRGADLVCCGAPLDAAALAHARHVAFQLGCHTLNAVSGANGQSAAVMPSLGLSIRTEVIILSRSEQAAPAQPNLPLSVDLRLV